MSFKHLLLEIYKPISMSTCSNSTDTRCKVIIQYPRNKNVSTGSYGLISNIQCNLNAIFSK